MAKQYTVSDGKLMLHLMPDEEGGYVVTSPIDPAMITQARSVEEAFVMAREVFALLAEARAVPDRWKRATRKQKTAQRKVGVGI